MLGSFAFASCFTKYLAFVVVATDTVLPFPMLLSSNQVRHTSSQSILPTVASREIRDALLGAHPGECGTTRRRRAILDHPAVSISPRVILAVKWPQL